MWACPIYKLIVRGITETTRSMVLDWPDCGRNRPPNSVLHAGRPAHPALSDLVMARPQLRRIKFSSWVDFDDDDDDGRHLRV
jgi:hypothetical protein